MALQLSRFLIFFLYILAHIARSPATSPNSTFLFNSFRQSDLNLSGSATVTRTRALQMTNGQHSMEPGIKGNAFFTASLQFKKPTASKRTKSFSTRFVFTIVSKAHQSGGHGFAFIVAPSPNFSNAMGGRFFGLFSIRNNGNTRNQIFVVEFDIVQQTNLHDIDESHVGVDINGVNPSASEPAAYYTGNRKKEQGVLDSQTPIQAWIEYDGPMKQLNVTIAPLSHQLKPNCTLISRSIDLSPVLLEHMYVGFSFGTQKLVSKCYILAWSFAMDGKVPELDLSHLPLYSSGLELYGATKGFKEELGEGGFGSVYKGVLSRSGIEVAVKRVSHGSKQGMREFVVEISSLGRMRHRIVVQLHGWCRRGDDLLLAYEFMPYGSIDNFLFDVKGRSLSWEQRFKILKGIASGLLYLHEEWEQVVAHRDVKASNVLLDGDLNGRLGDFGLSRLYEHGANPKTTQIVGSFGYMVPEFSRTWKSSTSANVYSYGALLLEVAYGRRPIEPERHCEEMVLVELVHSLWKDGRILDAMAKGLGIATWWRK
ncbi:L-type lectin-domain containing receptor kinase IV.2-like [Nymphaea colorata]|nr:L-type lectin-domain containing receptor kinase IV.2-like [Nymphaea colorata]